MLQGKTPRYSLGGPRADVDAFEMIKNIASAAHEPRPVGSPVNS